ncbi:MAG: DNA (cytosine-5-)-methyltransferase [Deltaproteobacteria bacterium]|nr:DNA (cytosine-5-)-methyltransferase [Deltaproteobacteria bacterium]
MTNKKVLSLFSGCGGMDLGFEGNFATFKNSINENLNGDWIEKELPNKKVLLKNTSFRIVFANDINKYAKISWSNYFSKYNYSPEIYHSDSIVNIINEHENDDYEFPKNIDVLTGGFPCQDFSLAGKRKGFFSSKSHDGKTLIDDKYLESRGNLYLWMIKTIEIVQPKIFVAENVKGLLTIKSAFETIRSDLNKINDNAYLVMPPRVLSTYEYGVPQLRERLIFIGFLKSSLTKKALKELSADNVSPAYDPYPPKTHSLKPHRGSLLELNNLQKPNGLLRAVTCGDDLWDLEEPEATSDESQRHYSKAKFLTNSSQGQKEISLDKPGPTIRSEHHGNIEFRRLSKAHGGAITSELNQNLPERRLTVRECARIQTFPDDYDFVIKSRTNPVPASEAYKVIGNAVPPLLAYNIAKNLEKKWELYFGDK